MENQDRVVKAPSLPFALQLTLVPGLPRMSFQELVLTRPPQVLSCGSHAWGESLCH